MPTRVEAAAAERAGLGEGHEIRAVVAAHLQHHRCFRRIRASSPSSGHGSDARYWLRRRQHDDAGAAIRARRASSSARADPGGRASLRISVRALSSTTSSNGDVGAFGNAAHLLDIAWLERLDDGQIIPHQRGHALRCRAKAPSAARSNGVIPFLNAARPPSARTGVHALRGGPEISIRGKGSTMGASSFSVAFRKKPNVLRDAMKQKTSSRAKSALQAVSSANCTPASWS